MGGWTFRITWSSQNACITWFILARRVHDATSRHITQGSKKLDMRQILGRTTALYHPHLTLFRTLTSQPFIISWIIINTVLLPYLPQPDLVPTLENMGDITPTALLDLTLGRHNFYKKKVKKLGDYVIFNLIENTKRVPIIYEKAIMIIKSIKFRNKTL